MIIIDPGHIYDLDRFDARSDQKSRLVFFKREGAHYPGNVGAHGGTNSQEVLRALLDRARYINAQIPCVETEAIISHLQSALLLFELRAARVHGEPLPYATLAEFEAAKPCITCGHVNCRKDHDHGTLRK